MSEEDYVSLSGPLLDSSILSCKGVLPESVYCTCIVLLETSFGMIIFDCQTSGNLSCYIYKQNFELRR